MPERNEETSIGEQIDIVMQELPLPVQNFLRSPARDAVSLELSRKYGLHADAAGVFERAYVYMLLGVYTPDGFVKELRKGGIDEITIKGLTTDVNEQVFKKLREEERREVSTPTISTPPQVPMMMIGSREEVPSNLPGQGTRPPPTSMSAPHLAQPVIPAAIPTATIPQQNYEVNPLLNPVSSPTPIYSNPAPQPVMPEVFHPSARTMAGDMALAAHGSQSVPQTPVFQEAPVVAPPPPAPIPAAPQPAPVTSNYPPPVMASVRLTPIDRTHLNAPITKEFGSDPYREPIE